MEEEANEERESRGRNSREDKKRVPYYRLHSRAGPVEAISSHKYQQEIGGYSKPTGGWSPRARWCPLKCREPRARAICILIGPRFSLFSSLTLGGCHRQPPSTSRYRKSHSRVVIRLRSKSRIGNIEKLRRPARAIEESADKRCRSGASDDGHRKGCRKCEEAMTLSAGASVKTILPIFSRGSRRVA